MGVSCGLPHVCVYLWMCVTDVNECLTIAGICGEGDCLNTDGSYSCICPDGYTTIDGKTGCQGTVTEMINHFSDDFVALCNWVRLSQNWKKIMFFFTRHFRLTLLTFLHSVYASWLTMSSSCCPACRVQVWNPWHGCSGQSFCALGPGLIKSQFTHYQLSHRFDIIPAAPSDPLVIAMGKKCSLIISWRIRFFSANWCNCCQNTC